MNYSICLDPANFDLTLLSGNPFLVYTNFDSFTTPVATVPYNLLFPPPIGSCPYLLSGIPNGATQLLIIDNCVISGAGGTVPANLLTGECCYALIDINPLLCSDFCEDCGIGFDIYTLNTTGSIIAGNLTSSCGEVTDYVIGWYLNGDYSSPVFTSGFGTQFNYQLPHPLTSSGSPLVSAGNWVGIIQDAWIGGTQYFSTSGSGNGNVIPFESCFGTVVANPLQCNNGSFPLPYTHQKSFAATSNGVPPAPTTFTYQLSSNTNYFAYFFDGQQVWDELEIKYISGNPNGTTNPSLYSQPIYLEKIKVGVNAPLPWLGNSGISAITGSPFYSYPTSRGQYPGDVQRTLTLTGLETSSIPNLPDKLEITVTPNTESFTTNWDLFMQCLEDFDCTNCTLNSNPPFKISNVTLERFTGNPCLQQKIQVAASGCNANSDFFTYTDASPGTAFPITSSSPPTTWIQLGNSVNCFTINTTNHQTPCDIPSNSIITFNKTNVPTNGISSTGQPLGQINMTFNNVNDFLHYKNFLDAEEAILNSILGPITYDCTNKNYYSGYSLQVPFQAVNNTCGDNTTKLYYYIPRIAYSSIIYVQNTPSNFWSITISMPELQDCLSFSGCTNCYTQAYGYKGTPYSILDVFNSSSYANPSNTISYSNNFGSKYIEPWDYIYFNTSSTAAGTYYSSSVLGYWNTSEQQSTSRYSQETIPFIPNPLTPGSYTNLYSLGSVACPGWTTKFSSSIYSAAGGGVGANSFYMHWEYVFPNIQDNINFAGNNDFRLFTKVTDNSGVLQTNALLIYSYSQSIATVHQPQFFQGGSPSLTIQSF